MLRHGLQSLVGMGYDPFYYNVAKPTCYQSLIQPTDAEQVLNGYWRRQHRQLDWQEQYTIALEAFQRNGFFMLVDDHQVAELDEEITLTAQTQVSFMKLVPSWVGSEEAAMDLRMFLSWPQDISQPETSRKRMILGHQTPRLS